MIQEWYEIDRGLIHCRNVNSLPTFFCMHISWNNTYLDILLRSPKNFWYIWGFFFIIAGQWIQSGHIRACVYISIYVHKIYISWCIKRFDSAFRHKHPVGLRASNKLSESFDPVCYSGEGETGVYVLTRPISKTSNSMEN